MPSTRAVLVLLVAALSVERAAGGRRSETVSRLLLKGEEPAALSVEVSPHDQAAGAGTGANAAAASADGAVPAALLEAEAEAEAKAEASFPFVKTATGLVPLLSGRSSSSSSSAALGGALAAAKLPEKAPGLAFVGSSPLRRPSAAPTALRMAPPSGEGAERDRGTVQDVRHLQPQVPTPADIDMQKHLGQGATVHEDIDYEQYLHDRLTVAPASYEDGDALMVLPKDWADKLQAGSIRAVHTNDFSQVFTARLACQPRVQVAIKVMETEDPRAKAQVRMMKRMSYASGTLAYFDSQVFPHFTYMLMEAASGNLAEYVEKMTMPEEQVVGMHRQPMSLDEALPLLIDVLRGARDMEREGVAHNRLLDENVLLVDRDGRRRAVVADFSRARPTEPTDNEASVYDPINTQIKRFQDAYQLPPQPESSAPSTSSNVWSAGLIFAKMILGYNPMQRAVWTKVAGLAPNRDGVDRILNFLREDFTLEDDEGVSGLQPEVRELLEGMLEKDPAKRWSALGTLNQAMNVASTFDISVPPEAPCPGLPECFVGDAWQ